MTSNDLDRVFGRGRLRMVTGDHVEVYREPSSPGERRRYTKRFLATHAGDFRPWTEREWRILARLVGHGIGVVPEVARFDRGSAGQPAIVQTFDAGITVDHWATLLPVRRDDRELNHVFEDAAHWWALARHALLALDAIHELRLVHLDLKADNVCIPAGPMDFDPYEKGQRLVPRFDQLALIDFAFSLVCGDRLSAALPLARQPEYDYQSPRLLDALDAARHGDLKPTQQLDWRCDLYSLAAMLRRYLPDPEAPLEGTWTPLRHAQARALVRRLLEAHDAELPLQRPHVELATHAARVLDDEELAASLEAGWSLASVHENAPADVPTPITRVALPLAAIPRTVPAPPLQGEPARSWRLGVAVAVLCVPVIGAAWWKWANGDTAAVSAANAPVAVVAQAPVASEAASAIAEPAAPMAAASATAAVPAAAALEPASAPEASPAPPLTPRVVARAPQRPRATAPQRKPQPERRIVRTPEPKPAKVAKAAPARIGALEPAPAVVSAPAPSSPPATPPPDEPVVPTPRDLIAHANEVIASDLPRIAQRAERLVLRVLFAATRDEQGDDVRHAARAIRLAPAEPLTATSVQEARQLNEAAQQAYFRRGDVQQAVHLMTRAFGANPLDAEVAGNLAFLRLRQQQPEAARQLALHALTTPHPRYPYGRIEDWNTFAIASALTGRERDARNAWFVSLALASDVDRQCRTAVNAYARHGDRLRAPVEAMLRRVNDSGRAERAAFCEWPPPWGR
jgi:hypothetical protein